MEKKEKVQDLNQIFTNHLRNFSATNKPTKEFLVTTRLSGQLEMFVRREVKLKLVKILKKP